MKKREGIVTRHGRRCPSRTGGVCDGTSTSKSKRCTLRYEAWAWSAEDGCKIYSKNAFPTPAAARQWRHEALTAIHKGRMRAPSKKTFRQEAEAWLVAARAGEVRTRSGTEYKPSALRQYEADIRNYLVNEIGAVPLARIRRADLQRLAKRLIGQGLSPSKIRNIFVPLRAIVRAAMELDELSVNPCSNLRLPKVPTDGRDRVADPAEAELLLAALPADLRCLYGAAFFGGLRRGELRGLRWADVDLARGRIHVRRGWDDVEGEVGPKSKAGDRTVPLPGRLRDLLDERKASTDRAGADLVFGRTATAPFVPSAVRKRAAKAWDAANEKETKRAEEEERKPALLEPIGLHECRHTYASYMVAAGVNAKQLSTFMGHSSITITLDIYAKLFEQHEAEAAALLDAFLDRSDTGSRIAQVAEEE